MNFEEDDYVMELLKKQCELERENKRLKEELDSFKPVVFQDREKGTVILYRKGDLNEKRTI